MSEQLPERINVLKHVSYDVQYIVNTLIENGHQDGTVTLHDVMEYIDGLVVEDFGCGYGHNTDTSNLIYQTDEGDEL